MRKLLQQSLFFFLCFRTFQAFADPFPEEIIVLGDSYSDAGNSRINSGSPLINRPSANTNGVVWAFYVARQLDAEKLRASSAGGTDFAFMGAKSIGTSASLPNPSILDQVNFIPKGKSRGTTLFVFGGIDDITFDSGTIVPGNVSASNMLTILKSLHEKGFDTLITFHLPDLGLLPGAGANEQAFRQQSALFNQVLTSGLDDLSFDVLEIDLETLFNEMIANPNNFQFSNVTTAPANDINGSGFLFYYDGIGITDQTHEIIGDYTFSLLAAPEFLSNMSQKPTSLVRQYNSQLKGQLYPIQPDHECDTFYLFLSGNYSPVENFPLNRCLNERRHQGVSVSFGVTDRVSDCLTLGIAGGYQYDFSMLKRKENIFKFDLQSWTVSALASFQPNWGYLNGIFTTAFLDFDDIKRKFNTGPAKFYSIGETDGMDYSGEIYGAYYFMGCECSIQTGPAFDINYQYVSINGYKEKKSSIGNLEYRDFNRNFLTTGLGWEVRFYNQFSCFDLTGDLYLMGTYQWLEDKEKIRFRETSLSAQYGRWPIKNPTLGYLSGGFHLSSCLSNGIIGSLGYDFNVGAKQMSEHFLTLSITFPLFCYSPCE